MCGTFTGLEHALRCRGDGETRTARGPGHGALSSASDETVRIVSMWRLARAGPCALPRRGVRTRSARASRLPESTSSIARGAVDIKVWQEGDVRVPEPEREYYTSRDGVVYVAHNTHTRARRAGARWSRLRASCGSPQALLRAGQLTVERVVSHLLPKVRKDRAVNTAPPQQNHHTSVGPTYLAYATHSAAASVAGKFATRPLSLPSSHPPPPSTHMCRHRDLCPVYAIPPLRHGPQCGEHPPRRGTQLDHQGWSGAARGR